MANLRQRRRPDIRTGEIPQLNSPMSLEQIEERLVKSVLGGTLALLILRNTRKPTSKLIKELLDIEVEVGQFIGATMQANAQKLKVEDMQGMLAGTLSFIPFPGLGAHERAHGSAKPGQELAPKYERSKATEPKSRGKHTPRRS